MPQISAVNAWQHADELSSFLRRWIWQWPFDKCLVLQIIFQWFFLLKKKFKDKIYLQIWDSSSTIWHHYIIPGFASCISKACLKNGVLAMNCNRWDALENSPVPERQRWETSFGKGRNVPPLCILISTKIFTPIKLNIHKYVSVMENTHILGK